MSAEKVEPKHTVESVLKDTGYTVRTGDLVIQVGLIYDHYKHGMLKELWAAAEKAAVDRMPLFKPDERFHESHEIRPKANVWYAFRYYTPATNILARPHRAGH